MKQLARERHLQDWLSLPAYELKFLNENAVALLVVRFFEDNEHLPPLADFFVSVFGEIQQHQARALVIDVRNNRGGRDDLGKLLLAHLLDHPFDYYKGIYVNPELVKCEDSAVRAVLGDCKFKKDLTGNWRLSSHPNFDRQQPVSPIFRGKLIVLMNGASFSTTAEFLTMLRKNRRATFVGEEAGGANCGNTSGVEFPFTLPNTGLRVTIPLMRYEMASYSGAPAHGVMPDVPVGDSIDDLLAGRDRALQIAIELAASPKDINS